MNFRSIIETQCFTFWVGEDQTPIEIHRGAVTSVSPVLAAMIGCGMKESTDGVAVLEHVDPETFKLFAEFCYTGHYQLNSKVRRFEKCFCINCGGYTCDRESLDFPYCGTDCQEKDGQRRTRGLQYCIDCGEYTSSTGFTCEKCHHQHPAEQTTLHIPLQPHKPSSSALRMKFKALEYPIAGVNQTVARFNPSDYVSSHAKLYIFADTYAVEGLKHLCLHLLHRDLGDLELDGWNIEEVIEMLRSTYHQPVKQTEDMYGVGEELRNLVMAYAGWRANHLSCYQLFNDLIAEGGDFATDFMGVLMEQLQSG